MPTVRILVGDVRARLAELPDESIQCVVTSPPYWGLRDYGCDGQIGLEPTIDEYVANITEVFREVRRVLRKDGTLWLNMGDCYSAASTHSGERSGIQSRHGKQAHRSNMAARLEDGLKPKDLVMQPARVALALQADGWWLRSEIVWAKGISFCSTYSGSCMPESCRDRPTTSHEKVFLMTKAPRYFYDLEAVREPHRPDGRTVTNVHKGSGSIQPRNGERWPNSGRNLRSVWAINPQAFPEAHFATFPERLVEPCIMAGTSEKGCCPGCGAPWVREVEQNPEYKKAVADGWNHADGGTKRMAKGAHPTLPTKNITVGWQPSCKCGLGPPGPCTVLDPFMGSGTVGLVAMRLGRSAVGIELNPKYAEMARDRIEGSCALLGTVTVDTGGKGA